MYPNIVKAERKGLSVELVKLMMVEAGRHALRDTKWATIQSRGSASEGRAPQQIWGSSILWNLRGQVTALLNRSNTSLA